MFTVVAWEALYRPSAVPILKPKAQPQLDYMFDITSGISWQRSIRWDFGLLFTD